MINIDEIKKNMSCFNKIGALEGGGITRLAFSQDDKKARNLLKNLFESLNLKIVEDNIGNIRGILEGSEPSLEAIAIGSHIDSVPKGGYYDGTLGVIVGLEILKNIKLNNIVHKRSIEVISFSCEEASRFNMATIGSKAMTGQITFNQIKTSEDKEGVSLYKAIKDMGFNIDDFESIKKPKDFYEAYIELHIEQGSILDNMKIPLGIPIAIASPYNYKLIIEGRADHSGATPMNMRKDALTGASEVIINIEDIAKNKAAKDIVATVGSLNLIPNALNVIPSKVELFIDLRGINKDDMDNADKLINEMIEKVLKKRELNYKLTTLTKDIPVLLDKSIIDSFKKEADKLNVKYHLLHSGAGHDAMHMNKIAKNVGMVFVPCKDGISHSIKEKINYRDIETVADVMLQNIIKLSNQ